MPQRRKCVCGKEFWFPGEFWQHKDCATGKKPFGTGLNPLYKETPAETVLSDWDGVERRKAPCAACEARKAADRAKVARWRAKK